ncbi:MAG: alpha/beta hydrolase [Alphaproteobacteria bacterium]|nr:alpha/beta hydrolase [Alphaproteobacteria bacterium]
MTTNEAPPTEPDWFRRAIDTLAHSRFVDVDGCCIHYLTWFDDQDGAKDDHRPGLLFVHGGGAHANWWRFIAPFFAEAYRVAAIDLSGMGDSGARETYLPEIWAREIGAVLEDARLGPHPVVVGHSFGGLIAMKYGAEHGDTLSGTVIVDSPVQDPNDTPLPKPAAPVRSGPRVYPDLSTALARFRLMPEQPCENAYITDFIAGTSIKQTNGGWTWKFDFKVMGSRRFGEPYGQELKALKCRAALIYGETSAIVSRRTVAYMSSVMGPKAPVVEIPQAHHHVMLDQPLAFVAALRAILDGWARNPL